MAQTSTGLNDPTGAGAGVTTYYSVTYDDSLSQADGVDRANALIASCDADFAQIQSWFGGVTSRAQIPISVQITTGGWASASWTTASPNLVTVTLIPGNGTVIDMVRYLLVAELAEVFMWTRNNGWGYDDGDTDEGVKGEGLSRFLGYWFLVESGLDVSVLTNGSYSFFVANYWMQEVNQMTGQLDRVDYLGPDPDDNKPDALTGCSTLFLWYLNIQLGYGITEIINAGASTLKGVYTNLTGDPTDPFPAFSGLMATAFPNGETITQGPNLDCPFPIYQQMQITCIIKPSSATEHIPAVGGTNQTLNTAFRLLQTEVIAMILGSAEGVQRKSSDTLYRFYVEGGGSTADVGVFYHQVPGAHGLQTTSYIATTPDQTKADNLLSLPECSG